MNLDDKGLEIALKCIADHSDGNYDEWIAVGEGLKGGGYDCSVWEEWSRTIPNYQEGVCEKKWKSFKPTKANIGSIIERAKQYGYHWTPSVSAPPGWKNQRQQPQDKPMTPTQQLITFLETLFLPDDIVGYAANYNPKRQKNDIYWDQAKGKWKPLAGRYDRTAAQLIAELKARPDDIGTAIGGYNLDAGGWIRINPLDGKGSKDENISAFRYALVESDSIPIDGQKAAYKRFELPIAAMINSGGKSVHAIVRIDARNSEEYRERVSFLYNYLKTNGFPIDMANANCSRFTRMPGLKRGDKMQELIAVNIGRKSWRSWYEFATGTNSILPPIVSLADGWDDPIQLPEELIEGILRKGHKMLLAGSSKAGKSFLLMELCIAIAEGREWLGFQCKQGKVLYINLEIDPLSARNRFHKIYDALAIPAKNVTNISIWDLRGYAQTLDQLATELINRSKGVTYDAVILDPIYKVIMGDENNASDMGKFCNQFDKICTEMGASAIYCHHHSKGAQGGKKAMDRASGSGVFARDPDAQLDMTELVLNDELKDQAEDGATAWRLETSLREFRNIKPRDFWFDYPIHRVDTAGTLADMGAAGSDAAARAANPKQTSKAKRRSDLETAFNILQENGCVSRIDLAEYLQLNERTITNWVKEFHDEYEIKKGMVYQKTPFDDQKKENGK